MKKSLQKTTAVDFHCTISQVCYYPLAKLCAKEKINTKPQC